MTTTPATANPPADLAAELDEAYALVEYLRNRTVTLSATLRATQAQVGDQLALIDRLSGRVGELEHAAAAADRAAEGRTAHAADAASRAGDTTSE